MSDDDQPAQPEPAPPQEPPAPMDHLPDPSIISFRGRVPRPPVAPPHLDNLEHKSG